MPIVVSSSQKQRDLNNKVSFYKISLVKLKVKYDKLKSLFHQETIAFEQRLAELSQENDRLKDQIKQIGERPQSLGRDCAICLDNQKNILLLPCCHLYFCDKCVNNLERPIVCPMCNTPSTGHIQIYQ